MFGLVVSGQWRWRYDKVESQSPWNAKKTNPARGGRVQFEKHGDFRGSLALAEIFRGQVELNLLLLPLLFLFFRFVPGEGRSVRTKGRRLTSEHVRNEIGGVLVISATGYAR